MTNEDILYPIIVDMHNKIKNKQVLTDRTGVSYVELMAPRLELDPAQKLLDFGKRKTPKKYVEAELIWYDSQSLNVNYIGEYAKTWKSIASNNGFINSNYGYLVYNEKNYSQYEHALQELLTNKDSRRAIHIYMRPDIWVNYNRDGMNDFICTLGVQYMIRDNKLYSVVNMRSNDIIYGFFNDFYWQATIQERLLNDLIDNGYKDLKMGKMIWVANSLHVYEKHFKKLNNMYEYLKSKRS